MAEPLLQNTFLIEIRLARTKWRIKRISEEIARLYSLQNYIEKHPHVTLFGPFSMHPKIPVPYLLKVIEKTAEPFSSIPFLINEYEMNQGLNGAVLAYRVNPTDPLVELTEAVSENVGKLAQTVNIWDTNPDQKWYHVTIANRLDRPLGSRIFRQMNGESPALSADDRQDPGFFKRIRASLTSGEDRLPAPPPPPVFDEDGLRITVINGDHIIAEYDLIQHRFFTPHAGHAAADWRKTLRQFRKNSGMELTSPGKGRSLDTYVTSDLHLGHTNIIKYCSRPFPHDAVDEMDEMLIRNWNYTVRPGDAIYHLGDFSYGPFAKDPLEYARRLNGKITFVNGNHDKQSPSAGKRESLFFEGIRFTLVHDPADSPEIPGTWVIHGHHHNNDMRNYPFINFEKRRINACCEMTGYRPVSLTELVHAIKEQQVKPKIKSILLRDR